MMRKGMVMLLLAAAGAAVLTGCGAGAEGGSEGLQGGYGTENADDLPGTEDGPGTDDSRDTETENQAADVADIRIGVIIKDENEGDADTAAHLAGIGRMAEKFGFSGEQVIKKTAGTAEGSVSSYDAAAELAEEGCEIVFGWSPDFEEDMLRAAVEYPAVQFCQAGGVLAPEAGVPNLHNYGLSLYEASYVSGMVAGLALNEMTGTVAEDGARLGYAAAYPTAADISRFTAFYLGARSVCPSAVMEVAYAYGTDDAATGEAAESLMEDGCTLIGCHAGASGVAEACGARGVPYVGGIADRYADVEDAAEGGALVYTAVDWETYYSYAAECVAEGGYIDTDWCRGYADGAVGISGQAAGSALSGPDERVAEAEKALKNGTLSVFATDTFTVGGYTLEERIEEGGEYEKYRLYVYDGYFHESEFGSAPAFDLIVDGIQVR